MFGSIGFPEMIMIFMVALLVFGPHKLPEIAKMLGKTIREFRRTVNEAKTTIEEELEKTEISQDLKDIKHDLQDIKDAGNDLTKP